MARGRRWREVGDGEKWEMARSRRFREGTAKAPGLLREQSAKSRKGHVMKRSRVMNTAIVAALILVVAGAATAQARVNFNVNIDVPAGVLPLPPVAAYPTQPVAVPVGYQGGGYQDVQPQVVVEEPPRFIYSPNLGFYVSVGTPEDIVYYNQGYYIYRDGYWYLSPS